MDNYQALQVGVYGGRGNVIPYGPGTSYANEAAVISSLPVGTLVYDTTETVVENRIKRIRHVANLNGIDSVNFNFALAADGTKGPWEFQFLMAVDGIPTSFETCIVSIAAGSSAKHFRFSFDNVVSKIYADWRQSSGTSFASRSYTGLNDGKYRKYLVVVTPSLLGKLFVDGVQQGTDVDLSGWSPEINTSLSIFGYSASGTKSFVKICNMVVSRNGTVLANVPFFDGSGAVATDKSGNGYNGTITDASPTTFWSKACIPISLGG